MIRFARGPLAPILFAITFIMLLMNGSAWADYEKIRTSGVLKVAVYKDFAPFSDGTAANLHGLDVDLAQALADQIGLKVSFLPFDAGENMNDDLRNMVWKGHYMGYGPADVMLHVPVDRRFMAQNDNVLIFAPYYRENYIILHALKTIPEVHTAADLHGFNLIAQQGTAGAVALLSADGGALRDQVKIANTAEEAVRRLLSGEVAAAMITRAEAESLLKKNSASSADYKISELQLPGVAPKGWVVGLAVRAEDKDLAKALDQALESLRASGKLQHIYEQYGVVPVAP